MSENLWASDRPLEVRDITDDLMDVTSTTSVLLARETVRNNLVNSGMTKTAYIRQAVYRDAAYLL